MSVLTSIAPILVPLPLVRATDAGWCERDNRRNGVGAIIRTRALPFLLSNRAEDSEEIGGRIHMASLTRFWRSGVPQLPGSTPDGHLSVGDAYLDFLAVWLQNGFAVEREPILIPVRFRHCYLPCARVWSPPDESAEL